MEDYGKIKDLMTPRRDIKASDGLRMKVKHALESERNRRIRLNWLIGSISLSGAAALLVLLLIPSGLSAREILAETITALRNASNIDMVVNIRTRSIENFRYIDIHEDFVSHHISLAGVDSLRQWRVDKGDRIAVGGVNGIYTWIPSVAIGMHIKDASDENILGYLSNLLRPYKILETELANCMNGNDADYKAIRKGDEIYLTVHARPQGNFDNPYLLNTSIAESENIRRYVIDAKTKKLIRASVSIITDSHETEVLTISSVNYSSGNHDIYRLPASFRFIETENQPSGLTGLSAEEAAATVLNAFSDWNRAIIDRVLMPELADKIYRETLQYSKLISVGKAFKSGSGNSIFVPYTLRLKDNTIQRHNIALQTNESGGWIVVGGI